MIPGRGSPRASLRRGLRGLGALANAGLEAAAALAHASGPERYAPVAALRDELERALGERSSWDAALCRALVDAVGCRNAGIQYFRGEGVKADRVKAHELLTRACQLGDTASCKELE